jgi:hypothetical protein
LSLLTQAIIGVVVAVLVVLFYKNKPPTPPSATTEAHVISDFWPSIYKMITNINLVKLIFVFGFI